MAADGYVKGTTILLVACDGANNPKAFDLAKMAKATVIASNGTADFGIPTSSGALSYQSEYGWSAISQSGQKVDSEYYRLIDY